MASAAAQVIPLPAYIPVRRFEVADLSQHGAWLLPRLLQAYPHLNERGVASWLQTLVHNNEYLFLYQEHGAALAQVMSAHTLTAKPVVRERFVWVEDKNSKAQLEAAAGFYDEFHRWAKGHGAEVIVVEDMTDVPHEMVKERLGRVFERKEFFARV